MRLKLRRALRKPHFVVAAALSATVLAAACSSGGGTASQSSANPNAPVTLTVWTDQPRELGFQQYEKLHPNVHFQFEVLGTGSAGGANVTLQQKTLLANKVGSGWPDIAFEGNFNNLAEEEAPNVGYPLNLTSYIPKSLVNGYSPSVISVCQTGGQLYCLRNDAAQNVFWYNEPLMKKFGYQVPTTWQQYQALGEEVAKQHPGYYVGDISGRYGLEGYFWAGQCPMQQLVSTNTVRVNTTAAQCTQMASLLDPLVKAGVLLTDDPFGSTFPKEAAHLLMAPGADWWGTFLFDAALHQPAKTWAAALPLKWGANGTAWTGDEGGGVYEISKHSQYIATAVQVIEWMATDTSATGFQAHATTYPAYGPAAAQWNSGGEAGFSTYYYNDPSQVFQAAAKLIWPGFSGDVAIDYEGAFNLTMTKAAASGQSLVSELPAWGAYVSNLCKAAGYTVTS